MKCGRCGTEIADGEHWVHVSIVHHKDPDNPERYARDNPKNGALSICPDCLEQSGLSIE